MNKFDELYNKIINEAIDFNQLINTINNSVDDELENKPPLSQVIKDAIEDEILFGIDSGVPYWFKSIMAFINKGMSKSKAASMILINGPRAILRMLCLYDSDTFLIIRIYNTT